MTSFVQPLDAGIIRCFKAHYRRAFCERAIDLDEAGEDDIYKINLLEVMMMANDAWDAISAETIRNCWNHTGIQQFVCHVYASYLVLTVIFTGKTNLLISLPHLLQLLATMLVHGTS